MRRTKRCLSGLLALLLLTSLLGVSALAADPTPVDAVTLVMPAMQAGTQIGADSIAAPDGAHYTVHVQSLRLLPFVGAQDALVTYPVGITSQTLEAGHVYELEFWFRADAGYTLGSSLSVNVQNSGSVRHAALRTERYTDETGAPYVIGYLTYRIGSVADPVTVTDLSLTANGATVPEVGKPLASSFSVSTVPANGVYKAASDVHWLTAAPGAAAVPAAGAVKAGQAYYTMSFHILAAEGYRFAPGIKLTLGGSPLPASMQRMTNNTYSGLYAYAYSYYGIQVQPAAHGTASAPDYVAGTDTVQLTAQPDDGYVLAGWTVTDQRGAMIEVSADNTFLMPDPIPASEESLTLQPVKVTPLFKTAPAPVNPFTDVPAGQYYYEPVLWAVNQTPQITNGIDATHFGPAATCTRGQVVTFLWRSAGCPQPKTSTNPFSDVKAGDYYYDAVLWAVENGITNGTSASTFSPGDPCTRAHVVTFLWRAQHEPAAGSSNPFTDVPAGQYYTNAVLWAVAKNVTNGTTPTTFSPASACTRGQIVTFLYRAQA